MHFVDGILVKSSRACGAAVAQGTHNPLVVGSNPSGPNYKKIIIASVLRLAIIFVKMSKLKFVGILSELKIKNDLKMAFVRFAYVKY